MPQPWTALSIPDLTGKTAIVTGANSGIGYEVALELAKHNCHVVMACRDSAKGEQAKKKILAISPYAQLDVAVLDLSSFASVKYFCEKMKSDYKYISLLVNNAGVMGLSLIHI